MAVMDFLTKQIDKAVIANKKEQAKTVVTRTEPRVITPAPVPEKPVSTPAPISKPVSSGPLATSLKDQLPSGSFLGMALGTAFPNQTLQEVQNHIEQTSRRNSQYLSDALIKPSTISTYKPEQNLANLTSEERYQALLKASPNMSTSEILKNFIGSVVAPDIQKYGEVTTAKGQDLGQMFEDQGQPLKAFIARSLGGIFGTPTLQAGQGIQMLLNPNKTGAEAVRGTIDTIFGILGATPIGAVINTAFAQPEIAETYDAIVSPVTNKLKSYAAKLGLPAPLLEIVNTAIDISPFLLMHKFFKTTEQYKDPITGEIKTRPIDRNWVTKIKNEFAKDINLLRENPLEYIKQKQFGLSIRDVSKDGELPKKKIIQEANEKDLPAKVQGEENRILFSPKDISQEKQIETLQNKDIQPMQEALDLTKLDDHISSSASIPQIKKNAITKTASKINEITTNVLEWLQDSQIRVKQLVENPDVRVSDISDPYLKSMLYPGKVSAKVNKGYEDAKLMVQEMKSVADEFKNDLPSIRKEVNNYLLYKHAPERNKVLGENASGITTAEAIAGLKRIESLPEGARIKEIAAQAKVLHDKSLEILKEGGVISDTFYNILKKKYENHVPLQRILETTEDIGNILSGKGFDVKTTGIRRAKGSAKEVEDILPNIINNYEQSVIRAEKNIVDQATLAFAKDNQNILNGLLEVKSPKVIGKDFEGKTIKERTNDPSILQLYEKGEPVWIKINDPKLAIAIRGIGREKLNSLWSIASKFTRLYSGLNTRFSPDFAFPNKIRDLQESLIFMSSQKDVGFKGALKTVKKDPESIKAVVDSLLGKDTENVKLYREMMDMGGTTGGLGLSTKEATKMKVEHIEKIMNSKTRKLGSKIVEYIDNWNTIFEDSTRLSVYKQALEQGLSKERAAYLAKEASINFNKMGTAGPVINALYMFSNASIQGSAKMIRSLKNPKVLGAVALTMATSIGVINEWNDYVDPNWRDKVSKWDRTNGLPVMLPSISGEVNYITIPVSWGLKPIKVLTEYAYDAISGKDVDIETALKNTAISMWQAYNPVGGSDLVSAALPTIFDVPSEIARNEAWSGSKIKPDYNPNQPESLKYFDSLNETFIGKAAIGLTEFLEDEFGVSISPADVKYGFDSYTGGTGRFIGKLAGLINGIGTGAPPSLSEYPFISRFYRERSYEEIGSNTANVTKKDSQRSILTKMATARIKKIQSSESLSSTEKMERIKEIRENLKKELKSLK